MTIRPEFYHPTPLDDEQLYKLAPSIFAHSAHRSRSERFRAIPTIQAVRALREDGWDCYGASQSHARSVDRARFTKHVLKFRHQDTSRATRVGDSMLETILTNANDGTKGYALDCGVFRLACLNGMVVKSRDFGSIRIRHTGDDVIGRVLTGTRDIARHAGKVMNVPDRWSRIMLSDIKARAFAHDARKLRFGDDERIFDHQLLIPRRKSDHSRDLWTVFNVVQENLVQGGLSQIRPEPGRRSFTSRAVTGIDANLNLNRDLWALGERFAKEIA
jgi:hypothetical protein